MTLTPVTPTGIELDPAELWPSRVLSFPREPETVAEDLLVGATLVDRMDGDAIWQLAADGSGTTRLAFFSSFGKEGWDARQTRRKEGFDMPGSCIAFRGVNYEVKHRLLDLESSRPGYVYVLGPWPDASPIRRIFVHDLEHHAAERAARTKAARERHFVYPLLLLGYPFLGMLPIERQTAIGDRYGLSPRRMTMISAMTIFAIAGTGVVVSFGRPSLLLIASFVLTVDSLIRFHHSWKAEEPAAFFPMWLLLRTYDAFEHERARRHRRRLGYPDALSSRRRAQLATQLDLMTPVSGGGFLVKSFTPKSWSDGITIRCQQRYFTVGKRAEQESPEGRLFVYALDPASLTDVFRTVTDYRPDEALRGLDEVERESRGDRFLIWAPILGLLPSRIQLGWVATGHLPLRAVQQSALMVVLFATTNMYIGLTTPSDFPNLDAAVTVFSGYLVVESVIRFGRAVLGSVTGSILGWPLALLVGLARRS